MKNDQIKDRSMLNEIVQPLTDWYRQNKRILPWRDQNNAYYTWVSEIMLQQTRVEAVKPYFQRFIGELPDVQALAECPEEKLMKLWEGLGYYNRVRNMQTAARTVVCEYEGVLPASYEELLSLKGIGNYTAGAIASIAYQIPVPAVDGNVLRVISRITEDRQDIMKQSVRRQIEENLLGIMPEETPGDFNQALMELGAVVCVPNGPARCEACPVSEYCLAYRHGTVEELPVKAPKKERILQNRTVLVIQDGEKTAIQKRPEKGLLAGLYELPNLLGHLTREEVLDKVYASGYPDTMIIQDFIPGDDSYMRVLTNYSDRNGKVKLMCMGHVLLEEPPPHGIGNHAVILNEPCGPIAEKIKAFLEDIGYVGFSNFDIKYDSRDGSFRFVVCCFIYTKP